MKNIIILLSFILLTGCANEDVKIGKVYIISFDYEDKNPFEAENIDTVKVIGLKGEYVQWQYRNGIKQSCKTRLFNELIRTTP
jgi:phosphoribosylformylglycinamidine (FGAM) synthase PurS component